MELLENIWDVHITSETFNTFEWFVVILYDKTSDDITVNDAIINLFTKKDRQLKNISPTRVTVKTKPILIQNPY